VTIEYANPQVTEYGTIEIEPENGWRWVPGITPGIAAHSDGTVRPTFGPALLHYNPHFGLYVPVADESSAGHVLMPVHLLIASAWLPEPNLSWYELVQFMHTAVVHRDGDNINNQIGNLAWADCPGDGDPAFYRWLMKEPSWARRRPAAGGRGRHERVRQVGTTPVESESMDKAPAGDVA
jgi:hypothetical protein